MKSNAFLNYLAKNFSERYDELVAKFSVYSDLLASESKIHNLTAIAPEDYDEKHFLDSLFLAETYSFDSETLIDVGSGAGFPGLVLAIAFPNLKVTVLEPTRKRCVFLALVVAKLELTNVVIISARAEDYVKKARGTFDLVTARAVASLPIILELTVPLIKVGGSALIMKGKNYENELIISKNAINKLNITPGKVKIHKLESYGSVRVNAEFIKVSETSPKYPRSFGQIKKNPL